ncbi:MAG: hypothetical protein RTV31_01930 [Candidatus Thorarchaeota archaeon]
MIRGSSATTIAILVIIAGTLPAFTCLGWIMQPLVIQMSEDPLAEDAATYVLSQLDNGKLAKTSNIKEIEQLVYNAHDTVFYVSHGLEEGIQVGKNIVEWNLLQSFAKQSSSDEHMALACYSGERDISNSKAWFGFTGLIDARIGADLLLAAYYSLEGEYEIFDHYRQNALQGILHKYILQTQQSIFLRPIEDYPPPTPPPPPDYDFYFEGIYWSSYNVDPNNEVYYDHPSYDYYYQTMGVGPANDFSIERTNMKVDHVSRAMVSFWKWGGVATIAEFLLVLGVALGVTFFGFVAGLLITALGILLAGLGLTVALLAEVFLQDETGSGWVFYKEASGVVWFKIGCLWWVIFTVAGAVLWPWSDAHYIR